MKEQIEEMAKVIAKADDTCRAKTIAEHLYKAGYRKQKEGEWIYKFTLDGDRFYECSVCGRKEVVNCLCKETNLAEELPYCHCGAKMKG